MDAVGSERAALFGTIDGGTFALAFAAAHPKRTQAVVAFETAPRWTPIELSQGDVQGIAVHIGARISALAGAGEVFVSSTVKDLVAGSGIQFEDRGAHQLKGVPSEWRVFAVSPPGVAGG